MNYNSFRIGNEEYYSQFYDPNVAEFFKSGKEKPMLLWYVGLLNLGIFDWCETAMNYMANNPNKKLTYQTEAFRILWSGFTWAGTPEGHQYWSRANDDLCLFLKYLEEKLLSCDEDKTLDKNNT